jgi:CheY-like chemotaxis protein
MTRPVNILVVDDLTSQRITIEAALADLGENIVPVRSGRDALKFLMENDAAVVFSTSTCRRWTVSRPRRWSGKGPRTPPPRSSSSPPTTTMQSARGYALGAVDYLTCPFLPDVRAPR